LLSPISFFGSCNTQFLYFFFGFCGVKPLRFVILSFLFGPFCVAPKATFFGRFFALILSIRSRFSALSFARIPYPFFSAFAFHAAHGFLGRGWFFRDSRRG